jgi:CRISPR system Cascade subunit CasE
VLTHSVETTTLTRIRLNRRSTAVRKDLADRTGMHRTLMRLVPDQFGPSPRQRAGLLFRYEADPHQPLLLIQTHHPPHLANLPSDYGHADTLPLAPMFHALTPGRPVRYRITATALRSRPSPPRTHPSQRRDRGKITALTGEEALAWWTRKAPQAGLTVHTADTQPHRLPGPPGTGPWPYYRMTTFQGHATITDTAALTHALLHGIGKGKPYGAGLLTIAPA